jgi:hypothetical protein
MILVIITIHVSIVSLHGSTVGLHPQLRVGNKNPHKKKTKKTTTKNKNNK